MKLHWYVFQTEYDRPASVMELCNETAGEVKHAARNFRRCDSLWEAQAEAQKLSDAAAAIVARRAKK